MVELALSVPIMVVLMLGVIDLARVYFLNIEVAGAARAGLITAIQSTTADIGASVRSEVAGCNTTACPSNQPPPALLGQAIPNNFDSWGTTGPGQAHGTYGDTNGCVSASFVGNQIACFAVRKCALETDGSGTPIDNPGGGPAGGCRFFSTGWAVVPPGDQNGNTAATPLDACGVEVLVVYKFTAATPIIRNLLPGGGPGLLLNQVAYAHIDYPLFNNNCGNSA